MKYLKLYEDFSDWDDEEEEDDEDIIKIDKFIETLESNPKLIKDYVFYNITNNDEYDNNKYIVSAYNLESAKIAQNKYTNFEEFLNNINMVNFVVYITNINKVKIFNYRLAYLDIYLNRYLELPNVTKIILDNIEKDDSLVYAIFTSSPDNMCFYDKNFNIIMNYINYFLESYGKYLIYYKVVKKDRTSTYFVLDSLTGELVTTKTLKDYSEINNELLEELGIK